MKFTDLNHNEAWNQILFWNFRKESR